MMMPIVLLPLEQRNQPGGAFFLISYQMCLMPWTIYLGNNRSEFLLSKTVTIFSTIAQNVLLDLGAIPLRFLLEFSP
jgi:hypothetical protein